MLGDARVDRRADEALLRGILQTAGGGLVLVGSMPSTPSITAAATVIDAGGHRADIVLPRVRRD